MTLVKCNECGKEISDKAKKCLNCGCKRKRKKSPLKIILLIMSSIILIGGIIGFIIFSKYKENAYIEKYEEMIDIIGDTTSDAEDMINLTRKVWYNSIFKEDDETTDKYTITNGKFNDDFNDSLSNLYDDLDFIQKRYDILGNLVKAEELFDEMKHPPLRYKKAHKELEELYDMFYDFCNLAINPSGSLTSYSDETGDLDTKIAKQYKKVIKNID